MISALTLVFGLCTGVLVLGCMCVGLAFVGAWLLTLALRILCWQRNFWWTFRYKGEPITVFFYDQIAPGVRAPFYALVHHRRDGDLIFETYLLDATFGRLSVTLDSYGTTWCWGHEGEEVEALKVSRALA